MVRRARTDRVTAQAKAAAAAATSTHSGSVPSRVAGVCEERSGTLASSAAGVNIAVFCTTLPSGMITALTPLVTGTVTVLLCSTARTRDIASCW